MADRIDEYPYYELDPGSPHMNADDYRHMGIPSEARPSGEPNEQLAAEVRARIPASISCASRSRFVGTRPY